MVTMLMVAFAMIVHESTTVTAAAALVNAMMLTRVGIVRAAVIAFSSLKRSFFFVLLEISFGRCALVAVVINQILV